MSLIDDIKRDREEGTQGPWGNDHPTVYTSGATFIGSAHFDDNEYAANTRRIARVPDMEAALLAADELADRFKIALSELDKCSLEVVRENYNCPDHNAAFAAYRKATGKDQ